MTSRTVIRIGLFAVGLGALFGGAYAVGAVVDPDVGDGKKAHGGTAAGHAEASVAGDPTRLVVEDGNFVPGVSETLAFRVVDHQGRTVRDFDVAHERAMHVIAVRRDLTGYQHVHPRQTADGGWAVDVAFPDPGPHRFYADFVVDGTPQTLAADLDVAGDYDATPLPGPARTAAAGDGYEVAVETDGGERRYTVSKDGEPVDDLEPYLGARGHLVALREGDLAFQHVHPKDAATEGREISFDVALKGAGSHRLFLQFQHDGKVRTAAFTESAIDRAPAREHEEDGHGH
ncbi:MAG TPA: hypothetical protein VEW67_04455 [Thermoleophilaceae bacterium]|nr:hypothetical protein [Thermoleophilaceae bacterium]